MSQIKFFKVTELPGTLENNALYFVKATGRTSADLYLTSATGVTIPIINEDEITDLIGELVNPGQFRIVADITERNTIDTSSGVNFLVLVLDASADSTVESGAALYAYHHATTSYVKIAEYESMDFVITTTADVVAMENVGALAQGETIPEGSSLQQVVEKLLRKVYNPTFVAPTATLTHNWNSLEEIGKITDITVTLNFNRGAINGVLVGNIWQPSTKQNDRAGAAINYTINGIDRGIINNLTDELEIVAGANTLTSEVQYAEGPQPLNSLGQNYQTPLATGGLTPSAVITGVYPYFGTTVGIATLTKQPLALMNSTYVQMTMVAEDDTYKQKAEFPTGWSSITGIQFYNTVSSQWEWIGGSKANSLLTFTTSSVTQTIQGNVVNYTRYTHNGDKIGSRQLRFYTN